MTNRDSSIPIVETYRGVGVHDQQPPGRVAEVVKPEIDETFEHVENTEWLLVRIGDITKSPESGLLAAAMLEAIFNGAAEDRRVRPNYDIAKVRAHVAGLNCEEWRDPQAYGSMFDVCMESPGGPRRVRREKPLKAFPR